MPLKFFCSRGSEYLHFGWSRRPYVYCIELRRKKINQLHFICRIATYIFVSFGVRVIYSYDFYNKSIEQKEIFHSHLSLDIALTENQKGKKAFSHNYIEQRRKFRSKFNTCDYTFHLAYILRPECVLFCLPSIIALNSSDTRQSEPETPNPRAMIETKHLF